jgi:dTDP-4-dehydrorhamnose reductase
MRILVTGGTGQIGAALLPRLAALGAIVAPNRAELDFARPSDLAAQLDRIAPHLIINCAAYTNVDAAEDERDLAYMVNAESPGIIARWAAAHRVPLVHLSSDYVFDGSGERPWREDDPSGPLSAYGASKLAGEQSVQAASGPHLIVRTSWIYAAQGRNFLRTIASLASQRSELRVVADQVGAPTSAAIVANGVVQILGASIDDLPRCFATSCGLVHLAATGTTSWHGFAVAIVQGLKARGAPVKAERVVPIPTGEYPVKAIRPRNSRLDLQRLAQVFGITPLHWTNALEIELDQLAGSGRPAARGL